MQEQTLRTPSSLVGVRTTSLRATTSSQTAASTLATIPTIYTRARYRLLAISLFLQLLHYRASTSAAGYNNSLSWTDYI